jgi:hypothetical protein
MALLICRGSYNLHAPGEIQYSTLKLARCVKNGNKKFYMPEIN